MFGYVAASMEELTPAQKERWGSVYCGICFAIGKQAGQLARAALRYDCAFLALLLMSLYEPEEASGESRCLAHPLGKKQWVDNEYIRYSADMNLALGHHNPLDDAADERKRSAQRCGTPREKYIPAIENRYGRQCAAMKASICELSRLEAENCRDIDRCAACFGALLGQLFVYRQDHWASALEAMGFALGRFIYLADCHCDLKKDQRSGAFNPYLGSGYGEAARREHLVMAMAQCSRAFEQLPLVQDKAILDNIIYSGVWLRIQEENHA